MTPEQAENEINQINKQTLQEIQQKYNIDTREELIKYIQEEIHQEENDNHEEEQQKKQSICYIDTVCGGLYQTYNK